LINIRTILVRMKLPSLQTQPMEASVVPGGGRPTPRLAA
jgi:hypothetical protein